MQTNLSINNHPAFGIKVSDNFVKAAHNYFNGVEYRPWRSEVFDKKVSLVVNDFGYDEFMIKYAKETKDGKPVHSLYAEREGLSVPLTQKDQFRKAIEKFMHMSKWELYTKIKQFRHAHPELKPLKSDVDMSDILFNKNY